MSHTKRKGGWHNTTKGVDLMTQSKSKAIPLAYSLLSAGPAVEIDEGYTLLDLNYLVTGGRDGCVAFIVTGDSMRDDILPGYIVFIDIHKQPRNGDAVVVNLNGQNCIKIFEYQTTRLHLVPKNSDYPTREVTPADSFHVLGVVKGHLAVY